MSRIEKIIRNFKKTAPDGSEYEVVEVQMDHGDHAFVYVGGDCEEWESHGVSHAFVKRKPVDKSIDNNITEV